MTEPRDTPRPAAGDDEYSATVLASHWVQRPEPDTIRATVRNDRPAPHAATLPDHVAPDHVGSDRADTIRTDPDRVQPDRADGTVLRFGPGVEGATAQRTHLTLPAHTHPAPPARRSPRRHALPALVLIAVLAFLAWQRLGPELAVHRVTVAARPATVGCDGTAELTATLTTNGRPGTVSYRWVRSDGTSSGVLQEDLPAGQKQARLRLLWRFEGEGRYDARAELHLLSPAGRTAATGLTYTCR